MIRLPSGRFVWCDRPKSSQVSSARGRSWAQACKTVEISCDHNECNGILMRSAEWRLISGFKLSLNALLIHSRVHNMCMHNILAFDWPYDVIVGGTRAESERFGRHDERKMVDDGRFPAELNFWNVEVLFDLTTNSSSCAAQLLKNVFKSKSTSTFSLGSGGVALVKSWRIPNTWSWNDSMVLPLDEVSKYFISQKNR